MVDLGWAQLDLAPNRGFHSGLLHVCLFSGNGGLAGAQIFLVETESSQTGMWKHRLLLEA